MKIVEAKIGSASTAGKVPSEEDFDTVVKAPCRVLDQETGETLAVVGKIGVGIQKLPPLLQESSFPKSSRTNGMYSMSNIFGYLPRVAIRNDFCRRSFWASKSEAEQALFDASVLAASVYRKHLPRRYEEHMKDVSESVLAQYRMKDTPFTSGIVNKNSPLHYHKDSGNFKGRWSCMLTLRKRCEGGLLVLPELRIALACEDGDVSMFSGQSLLHGVTPIRRFRGGYRYSAVFYSLKQMWQCLPPAEEMERARSRRETIEVKRWKT
jgi:hypothetical protein